MKNITLTTLVIGLNFLLSGTFAFGQGKPEYKPGEFIVRYKSEPVDPNQNSTNVTTHFSSLNEKHAKFKVKEMKSLSVHNEKARAKGFRVLQAEGQFLSNIFVLKVDELAD